MCYEEEIKRHFKFYDKKKNSIEKKNKELITKRKKKISNEEKLNEVSEEVTEQTNEELEKKLGCTTEYFKFFLPLKEKLKIIREKAKTSIKQTSEENLQILRKSFFKEIEKRDQLKAEAKKKYRSTHKSLKREYNSDLSSYIKSIKYNYFCRVIRHIDFLDVIGITKAIEKNEDLIKSKAEGLTANYLLKYKEDTDVDTFSGDAEFEFGLAEALKEDKKKVQRGS